jgi:hypothetical protein|tara:strand:+ start:499 stop:687 length:189 start_codon:yes stop_codon:yes gene_type:complete
MFYVVDQIQYSNLDGNFNVIAKFEYKEEAQKLVDAKEIAYNLEKQAVNNSTDNLRFFIITKV